MCRLSHEVINIWHPKFCIYIKMYVSIQCFGIEIETNNGYPLLNFIYFTSELKKKKNWYQQQNLRIPVDVS